MVKLLSNYTEQDFVTVDEARLGLLTRICQGCLDGDEASDTEPPNQNDIEDLLSTPCGMQYWLED